MSNSHKGSHDFDFFYGRWRVHNRRLTKRLQGCTEWERFEAIQECAPLLGGLGNIDQMQTDTGKTVGWSLRLYNPNAQRWSIYWVGGQDFALSQPVHGSFANGNGHFDGPDEFEGKPILVKFLWSKTDTPTPHWEQAFSADGGRTWEMNWEMDFTKFASEEGRLEPLEPPIAGSEEATLLGFLERQRATFAWKCGDLDAAGLRATLDPSTMTLGGVLKHLARFEDDMSTEWLHGREQLPPWNAVDWSADPTWDWRTAADDSPEQLYARWRDAVTRSRALFAEAMAGGGPTRRAGGPDTSAPSLRYILLNMIEEYARHNGHADLIRESIDGRVGQDPPSE